MLHRARKQGLGRAYLAGFEVALDGGADLVMEMDADFSHDPADVPRLHRRRRRRRPRARLALRAGRRGRELGPRAARLISRGGCAYARLVLGVPVRDLTGGFKCFNRRVLEALDLEPACTPTATASRSS